MSYHYHCKKTSIVYVCIQSLKLTYKKFVDAAGCDPGKLNALYIHGKIVYIKTHIYIYREVHANVYNVYLPSLSPLSVRHRLLFFFPLKHILPFLFQIEAPAKKEIEY